MNLSIFLGGLRPGSRGWLHPRTTRPVGRLWQRFSCPSATHDCVRGVREKARKALVRKGSTSAFNIQSANMCPASARCAPEACGRAGGYKPQHARGRLTEPFWRQRVRQHLHPCEHLVQLLLRRARWGPRVVGMNLSIFLGGLRPGSRGWLHPRTTRPVGRLWQRFSCPSATHDCVRGVREKARKALVRKGSTSAFNIQSANMCPASARCAPEACGRAGGYKRTKQGTRCLFLWVIDINSRKDSPQALSIAGQAAALPKPSRGEGVHVRRAAATLSITAAARVAATRATNSPRDRPAGPVGRCRRRYHLSGD